MTEAISPEGIRVHTRKNGNKVYEARVKRKPLKELTKTFKSLGEAIAWRLSIEALINNGIDPTTVMSVKASKTELPKLPFSGNTNQSTKTDVETESQEMTVRQAIDIYLKHRAQSHKKLPANQITNYNRVAEDWENYLVSNLRNEDLANYITELLCTPLKWAAKRIEAGTLKVEPPTYAPATARKFIYAMKVAIKWQAKNGKTRIHETLFDFDRGVIPAAWAGRRERRLAPGEEERLYAAGVVRGDITYTPDEWRALIGFTLETAMRQQELAMAEWKHLSPNGLQLHIPAKNSKTKTSRNVLLSKKARAIVESQRLICPNGNPRIFHQFTSAGSICDSFAKLTGRAKIEDLTFHDLRHEAVSRLCQSEFAKLGQMTIMEMTGHSSLATFRGYVHLINSHSGIRLD